MSSSKPQPASWETADHRFEEKPSEWLGTATCLIEGCDWKTEWRGGYEAMHRLIRKRLDSHQKTAHDCSTENGVTSVQNDDTP